MIQTNKKTHAIGIEENKYKHLRTINPNDKVSIENSSIANEAFLFGILGALGMVMLLVTAQVMIGNAIVLKLLKFIALFAVLGYGINAQGTDNQNNYNFKNGIQFSVISTVTIAISLALINILIFWILPNVAFDTLSTQADSIRQLVLSSRIFFLETLVFGVIITFIILRGNKTK